MGASTNGRVQRSAADWEALLARYEKTGRSRAAFCRVEGIARSTFDVWYRKLRRAKPSAQKKLSEFVEVTPTLDRVGGWTFEIELPDGTVARMQV